MLSPGSGLLRGLLVWCGLGVVAVARPEFEGFWRLVGVVLGLAALAQAWELRGELQLVARRTVPPSLALGQWVKVTLGWTSSARYVLELEAFDHSPLHAEVEGQPLRLVFPAGGAQAETTYYLLPRRRGEARFGRIELWRRSSFDFWRRRHWAAEPQSVRVLPNFKPIAAEGLVGIEERMLRTGVHLQRRRGQGLEFRELRDYRPGDSLRLVDWKATARRSRLVSRTYQDEQNQQVVLLIDCGRRMHSEDGDLSHFDHVLDAAILLAYVAVRQGDAVGFQAFAGEERWLQPVHGPSAVPRLLDIVYDLETSLESPDFMAAAMRLMERQRRRSLVIWITNLRDEDAGELLPAIQVLRRRHLVLVASLRERALARLRDQPVTSFDAAVEVAAAHQYLAARQRAHAAARAAGAALLDVEPQQLPYSLVARYLDIKRAGRL